MPRVRPASPVGGRVALTTAAVALFAGACAQETAPIGGPVDPLPPRVVRVSPESGAVNIRPGDVEFRFDEVVSERPAGAPSLERLFIISPRDGDPRVRWRRDALTVRPRGGWRPNTTYRVTLLPGVQDLRSNRMDSATVVVFSTGGEIVETRIRGTVFNWAEGRPLADALVFGISRPDTARRDSTVYVTRSDAQGRFELPHVPPGAVTVLGLQDANNNFGVDPREAWDSTRVTLGDSARVELYAFVQDTVGPVMQQVALIDSVTVGVTLNQPLSITTPLTPAQFSVLGPDSLSVPVTAVYTRAAYDSLARRPAAPTAADTAAVPVPPAAPAAPAAPPAPARGTLPTDTAALAPPVPSRPIPATEVVLQLARPLRTGTVYAVEARGLRNLLEYARDSRLTLNIPEPPPPAPRDSAPPPPSGATPPPTARRR